MDMICVEGYKAFRGTMRIAPQNDFFKGFDLSGEWLYRPDTDCWYCKGQSFPASICEPIATK